MTVLVCSMPECTGHTSGIGLLWRKATSNECTQLIVIAFLILHLNLLQIMDLYTRGHHFLTIANNIKYNHSFQKTVGGSFPYSPVFLFIIFAQVIIQTTGCTSRSIINAFVFDLIDPTQHGSAYTRPLVTKLREKSQTL